jgi:hypothetical protein
LTRGLAAVVLAVPVAALAIVAGPTAANAQDNGVGLTPALGWSSWSFVRHNPTAATIEAQADAMKSSDLAKVGFQYVNVDGFWYQCPGSQGPNVDQHGRWVIDSTKFPSSGSADGITAVADHVYHDGLLWSLAASPLILGTDLTNLDPTDLALLKNRDVLAVDRDAIHQQRHPTGAVTGPPPSSLFEVTPLTGTVLGSRSGPLQRHRRLQHHVPPGRGR